ncbi:MAG: glycosyltransferase family 2 protein [Trichococcus flocculiformis]|jgi:glucosyltransferase|uniref:glycosyltransferase family 2 protein n=1 Tax=Trichococcus shcherbakoviae TaxID=2094020 RepID=UPI001B78310E|nr:glycosyltransferase family 2 protein [Trichococcus shcherbakoviae]MBP8682976.1 glycosyltransferase family 2 protein [Trichococcus sp.]MBP9594891.1 glycosyltransferase family 2 protein [Trichococcus sp.]MBP9976803.1 glycosyltransferase family 2 protein [Trichococcus sp.]
MSKDIISIVVPCHNEEEMVPIFHKEITAVSEQLPDAVFEMIFVNDGSKDATLAELKRVASLDERVHYLSFSRNFGKEAAMVAGLRHATGNYVAVMDADLQDPPAMLVEMVALIRTGEYDCIGTKRLDRKGEPPIRSFFARQFYQLINRISDTEIVDGARDFRLMTRQMVDAVLEMTEYNRFSKGIFSWVGFETKYLSYENQERVAGKTTWSFWSLFKYSLDGIVAFSEAPLAIAAFTGFLSFAVAILAALILTVRTLVFGNATSGWTSLIVIILGMGGLQLLCLGILGKYLGKTFMETKRRPLYILKETDGALPTGRKEEQNDD